MKFIRVSRTTLIVVSHTAACVILGGGMFRTQSLVTIFAFQGQFSEGSRRLSREKYAR